MADTPSTPSAKPKPDAVSRDHPPEVRNRSVKAAVVTGGTRGLGRELSLQLAAAGYSVCALWGSDDQAADQLQQDFQRRGYDGRCIRWDVGSGSSVPELGLGSDFAEFVVVHNATAPFTPKPFHLLNRADFEQQLSVATFGFVDLMQALLRPLLKAQRKTVVAVTTSALTGAPPRGFSYYVAGKTALAATLQSLAVEYGPRGLRAFCVAPGFMRTSLTDRWDVTIREAVAASGERDVHAVAARVLALIADDGLFGGGESFDL